ncbi:MAG: carboxypeptidase-like regulatory domain-containing protein [Bacteroidota bacterium]
MQPIFTAYPQFAPNQVLSSSHLNQLFDYLGEQERLTRTHLIGIGIVCGLEAELNANGTGLTISRGCGVTSAGHLVIWDEDEALEFFTPYELPEDIDYTFFDLPDGSGTYPMWALTTDRNDDPDARELNRGFLIGEDQAEGEGDEKVLILLFECQVMDNRNCTPNNCDDKGRTVETAVKPVLVRRGDLEEIRRVLAANNTGVATYYSLYQSQAARLGLPTVRAPRFDVGNSQPTTTRQLFETYQGVLSAAFLARVQAALDQAYTSLAPLLSDYPSNPFASRLTSMTFLHDGRLFDGPEVMAYQYYFDHLVTILHAYEELRAKAEELFSLCCPDDRIFPRHLVLHHFTSEGFSDELRHLWVSSPVQNRQAESRRELASLFDRLVALVGPTELPVPTNISGPGSITANTNVAELNEATVVTGNLRRVRGVTASNNRFLRNEAAFSHNAGFARNFELATLNLENRFAVLAEAVFVPARRPTLRRPIRITPSFLGKPLSLKALPYYYDPRDLLALWNYQLTRKGREGENFGFDALSWNATDDFVRRPLFYDLEPRNFLRIEGAVGQNYLAALAEVRRQVNEFRLPIDVVALRTGTLTDGLEIQDYDLHFAELEAQYATWRARLLGRLAEVAVRFYDTKILGRDRQAQPATAVALPQAPLLRRLTGYRYLRGTVGEFYEANYNQHTAAAPFTTGLDFNYFWHLLTIHTLVRLENNFSAELRNLDFDTAETALANLQGGGRFLGRLGAIGLNDAEAGGANTSARVDLEELSDQFDELITAGDLDALRALYAQYEERREEILRRQLFSGFQQEHPGLQFKAGTELGGTFILVYHGEESEDQTRPQTGRFRLTGRIIADGETLIGVSVVVVGSASGVATDIDGRFSLVVNQLPVRLRASYVGFGTREILVTREDRFLELDLTAEPPGNEETPIEGIDEGTVIADFYLPYRCCGRGAPIHIFPPEPPAPPVEQLVARSVQEGCTFSTKLPDGTPVQLAPINLAVTGGTAPYFVEDAAGNRQPLPEDAIQLADGLTLFVLDSVDQRTSLTISLLPELRIELVGEPICAENNETFSHEFIVEGGRPPYRFIDPVGTTRTVTEGQVGLVSGIASGQAFVLEIQDGFGEACLQEVQINAHTCSPGGSDCGLPCGGIATRASYPMWAQKPATQAISYQGFDFELKSFELRLESGQRLALTIQDLASLNRNIRVNFERAGALTSSTYTSAMGVIVNNIMKTVDVAINANSGLPDGERAITVSTSAARNFNRLVIENFDCHGFQMVVSVKYIETDESNGIKVERERQLVYENGRVLSSDNEQFPSFERFQIDRCDENVEPKPVCESEVKVDISRDGTTFLAQTELTNRVSFWWDVQLGEPGLATKESVDVDFAFDGTTTVVQVLMVDPVVGCFDTATSRFSQ